MNKENEKNLSSSRMLEVAREVIEAGGKELTRTQTITAVEKKFSVKLLNPELFWDKLAKTTEGSS